MEPIAFLDFPAWGGRFSRARGLRREPTSSRMIVSESRNPRFGIMLQAAD
jgi:hypothetical protein